MDAQKKSKPEETKAGKMAKGAAGAKEAGREKKSVRDSVEKRKLMNRLKRIEGQIRGLENMLEKDAYCPDILTQSMAAAAALNGFRKELLASHLRTCVVSDMQTGDDKKVDDAVNELTDLLRKMMR